MAYTHSKYEVRAAEAAALTSTGDKGTFAPGMVPHHIRAVACVMTQVPSTAAVLKIDKRPNAGSDTGRGDGDLGVINFATSHTAGTVVYLDGLNHLLRPGEEAVARVSTAAGGATPTGRCHIIFYVEPHWELPANVAAMKRTT
jgi:hypothetical protein